MPKSSDNLLNLGFIATRLKGSEVVSLEIDKWITLLHEMGHACYYFAGEHDDCGGVFAASLRKLVRNAG